MMRKTKEDIRLFRIVSVAICFIGLMIGLFVSQFGYFVVALGLFFLFTPHKEGEDM